MYNSLTVREVAGDEAHPRNMMCKSMQATKAFGYACFLLRLSQIPGTNLPKLKEFSAERMAKSEWIEKLKAKYHTDTTEALPLAAWEGDIFELPQCVALAFPWIKETPPPANEIPAYGRNTYTLLGERLVFEMRCLPDSSTLEIVTFETKIYWLNECLEAAHEECRSRNINILALPYQFPCITDEDILNWPRYVQSMQKWVERYQGAFRLLLVGEPGVN